MYCGWHWVVESIIHSLCFIGSNTWAVIKVLVFPAPGYCHMISFQAEFYRQWEFRAIQSLFFTRIYLTKYIHNTYLILTFQIALTSGEEVFIESSNLKFCVGGGLTLIDREYWNNFSITAPGKNFSSVRIYDASSTLQCLLFLSLTQILHSWSHMRLCTSIWQRLFLALRVLG